MPIAHVKSPQLCATTAGCGGLTDSPLIAASRALSGFCGRDWRGEFSPPLTGADRWAQRNLSKAVPLYQGVILWLYAAVGALVLGRRPGLALAVQFFAMAVLVLRGVHDEAGYRRAAAVVGWAQGWPPSILEAARILAGVFIFTAAEVCLADAVGTGEVAIHLVFAFGGAVMSDYVCHRFIWHANWSVRAAEGSWDRWLWTFVRGHHIQHYLGHHKHTQNAKADAAMRNLQPVPLSIKEAAEAPWSDDALATHALSA